MSSEQGHVARRPAHAASQESNDGAQHDRLLPWIAAERSLRAVVLVAIGVVLLTHPHTDWAQTISDVAHRFGFDPNAKGLGKLIAKAGSISTNKYEFFGVVAIGYGVLEGAEGYGLWRRRRWGEYLTIVATALLFIPEIWEIIKAPTPLKLGALVLNIAVVIYLIVRLRRHGG